MTDMTQPVDIEALRALMEREKDARHCLSLPGDPAYPIEQARKTSTKNALREAAVNALPSLLTELEALRAERGRMGLCRPVPEPPRKFTWDRDERDEAHRDAYERFQEGIGGGYHGQGESDTSEQRARCGVLLAYSLTDYGARSEAEEWPQCRIRAVGDGWHPDASYGLDRLAMSFSSPSAPAWAIEAVIGIATEALSTTL